MLLLKAVVQKLTEFMETNFMKQKGFTLIELAVATGIFSVVCIAGIGILIGVMQSANRAMVQNELRQNASAAMETMIREIRKAKGVNITATSISTFPNSICAAGTADATFTAVSNGNILYNTNNILQDRIIVGAGTSFGTAIPCQTSGNIAITLKLDSNYGTRSDFVGSITLRETVALRNY